MAVVGHYLRRCLRGRWVPAGWAECHVAASDKDDDIEALT